MTKTQYSISSPTIKEQVDDYKRRVKEGSTPSGRARQLREEADALDREAERMEGTCWLGAVSPSQIKRDLANQKRRDAQMIDSTTEVKEGNQ